MRDHVYWRLTLIGGCQLPEALGGLLRLRVRIVYHSERTCQLAGSSIPLNLHSPVLSYIDTYIRD